MRWRILLWLFFWNAQKIVRPTRNGKFFRKEMVACMEFPKAEADRCGSA